MRLMGVARRKKPMRLMGVATLGLVALDLDIEVITDV